MLAIRQRPVRGSGSDPEMDQSFSNLSGPGSAAGSNNESSSMEVCNGETTRDSPILPGIGPIPF